MRQNQQNRRMRGRGNGGGGNNNNNNNNNNRRGPNPLTRSYESNGPDVKVRGTAQNIADKYLTLARDAHSSGDRVMAENYLQHAEHYNRIIAAALAQQQQQFQSDRRDEEEDDLSDGGDNRFADNRISLRQEQENPEPGNNVYDGEQPQPVVEVRPEAVIEQPIAQPLQQRDNRPPREGRPAREAREPRESREVREPRETKEVSEVREVPESSAEREEFRPKRRERTPRPPRAPRIPVDADGEQPDAGGLLATLARGADKPTPVPTDE